MEWNLKKRCWNIEDLEGDLGFQFEENYRPLLLLLVCTIVHMAQIGSLVSTNVESTITIIPWLT